MNDTPRGNPEVCDRFLGQMLNHHRHGDFYPDPKVVGAEVQFAPAETEAVMQELRERVWIARSPYASERIRITAWGWQHLREHTEE